MRIIVYCTVRLRFPEDKMIYKVFLRLIEGPILKELTAKETALCLWATAKLKI